MTAQTNEKLLRNKSRHGRERWSSHAHVAFVLKTAVVEINCLFGLETFIYIEDEHES